jgi:hypothetical protein
MGKQPLTPEELTSCRREGIIFCFGVLHDLKELGLTDVAFDITPDKGMAHYESVKDDWKRFVGEQPFCNMLIIWEISRHEEFCEGSAKLARRYKLIGDFNHFSPKKSESTNESIIRFHFGGFY